MTRTKSKFFSAEFRVTIAMCVVCAIAIARFNYVDDTPSYKGASAVIIVPDDQSLKLLGSKFNG